MSPNVPGPGRSDKPASFNRRLKRHCPRSTDPDQHLTEVPTVQDVDEALRRLLETVADCFAPGQALGGDETGELADRFRPEVRMVGDDETLHADALGEENAHVRQPRRLAF